MLLPPLQPPSTSSTCGIKESDTKGEELVAGLSAIHLHCGHLLHVSPKHTSLLSSHHQYHPHSASRRGPPREKGHRQGTQMACQNNTHSHVHLPLLRASAMGTGIITKSPLTSTIYSIDIHMNVIEAIQLSVTTNQFVQNPTWRPVQFQPFLVNEPQANVNRAPALNPVSRSFAS